MNDAHVLVLAFSLALGGLTTLSLAMSRHQEDLLGRVRSHRWNRSVQALGALLLLATLTACVRQWGGPIGVVAWLGMLTAAGQALVLLLRYLPGSARHLAWLAPSCGVALWLI